MGAKTSLEIPNSQFDTLSQVSPRSNNLSAPSESSKGNLIPKHTRQMKTSDVELNSLSSEARRTMNLKLQQQHQETLDKLQAERVESERKQQREREKLENDSKQKIEEIQKLAAEKEKANQQNKILQ